MQYLAIISGIFGLEWKIKNYIEKNVPEGEVRKKAGGFLVIRKYHNKGAFLNLGEKRQKAVMLLSVLLTAALTVFFALTLGTAGKGLLKWGLTLLLGGAYSNTYDRLFRKYVVDYVSFRAPAGVGKVVFNIGDFCIMIGSLLVLLSSFKNDTIN
ncbi:MAG: signal peptidase II [Clostridium sp.]|nr:signal peptidase II [Clostridium sp.]